MSRFAVRLEKLVRAVCAPRRQGPVKRILIAQNLLLGDTLLLAALFKALALRYPEAERVALTRPSFAPLFEHRPYGVRVLEFERRNAASQRAVMRSGPYDLALVPDDNRYAWLARAAGARWIVGFADDRPAWKNWMLDEAVPYPATPAAWADMAVALSGSDPPPVFVPGEWPAPSAAPYARPNAPYAVLHVGASTPLKTWPAERWRSLAETLKQQGLVIVWSAGRGEESLLQALGVAADEIDLAARLDLAQLWDLLALAQLVVCPDTGVAHLARLAGAPTVTLFGPGSVEVHGAGRFFAGVPYQALTAPDFPCRDQRVLYRRTIGWVRRCGRAFGNGPGQCPHPRCMDALAESDVSRIALATLRPPRA